jgi:hypothetical protein
VYRGIHAKRGSIGVWVRHQGTEQWVTPQVHSSILHEIVRLIDGQAQVPECVRIRGREYQITYLEDHKQRIEEALRRRDSDRLSMLYGQLSSKVKYQVLRRVTSRAGNQEGCTGSAQGVKRTAIRRKPTGVNKSAKPSKKAVPDQVAKGRMARTARG